MLQAYRLALIGLLALMQLFAPLVHAHAGGADFPGVVHLPGLEFLADADEHEDGGHALELEFSAVTGGIVARPATRKACLDVIVGLAPGLQGKGGSAAPVPHPDLALPPCLSLRPTAQGRPLLIGLSAPPSPAKPCWLTPSPRAPPKLG